MRIPPEIIDEVRAATDIVDVIGALVPLKKRGKNFLGLCPFHQEKTPSFNVSPERQMYHCFGCGVGGNVFTFLMEFEKISFVEAVKTLAERAAIQLPTQAPEQGEPKKPEEDLYNICRIAALHFYENLHNTNEGTLALEYFKFRGFTPETLKTFGLGYSMQSWDDLLQHAKEQNITAEKLEQAGLARQRDDKSVYDYFRGRAMFPIFSRTGRVVGFGARKMYDSDPLGKYINSPETPIYQKSRILYGLFQAKEAIREKQYAILVEGYADLISVYQAGFRNIVASSGTALTREQIRLLKDYAPKIIVMYDADSAGSAATLRGVDLILEQGLDVRVVELPEGHDPDTYVRKVGPKAFQERLDGSVSFIDYIARRYEREGKFTSPEGRAETVHALVQLISKIEDEIKRNFYIKQIANDYDLPEATLHREVRKIGSKPPIRYETRPSPELPQSTLVPVLDNDLTDQVTEIPIAERDLIHAMVDGGSHLVGEALKVIQVDEFLHPGMKRIAGVLKTLCEEGKEIDSSSLIDAVGDDGKLRDMLADILFTKYQLSRQWNEEQTEQADPARIARAAIIAIRRRQIDKAIEENQKLLRIASEEGEDVSIYLQRHAELYAERQKLDEERNRGSQ